MDVITHAEPDALERILDGQERPGSLDFHLLRRITGDFSDDQIIGRGGCGVVYKGILPNNGIVAVKKLIIDANTVDEKMFRRELGSTIKVRHQNIVRFLGYCSEVKEKAIEQGGKTIMAEERVRLLCFEYIRKGSLDKYLTDELRGLEWHTRYQIIMGICKGLLHLHKDKRILHMDLKPANILLDDKMVPKITDFGLAALDGKSQTTSAQHMYSPGYCAPEYIEDSKRSTKADIYSLGVIIIEMVTGSRQMPNTSKVLRRWRHRWNKSSKHTPMWYHQVKKCLLLGVCCKRKNPVNRPHIWEIIHELSEIDSWDDGQIKAASDFSLDKIMSSPDDMLGIEPLEFHFPFAHNHEEQISCSIELTNNTADYLAFKISTTGSLQFSIQPDKDIAAPRSKCTTTITLSAQEMSSLQKDYREEIIVQSTKVVGGLTAMDVTIDMFNDEGGNSQKRIDDVDKMVDEVTVVFNLPLLRDEPLGTSSQELQQSMALLTYYGPKDSRSRYIKVLERILQGIENPSRFPFSLLEDITENFSRERKIGNGGCAEIYKGILGNHIIAVKKLFKSRTVEDRFFEQEITTMMMVKHQNILRLLGYCSHTEEQALEIEGKYVVAQIRERLICLEYASNGSLEQYLTDELQGLEWHTRYQIILSICEGLQHLHKEKHIIHMNLKPSNILFDDHMVPKISDFGLSRLDEKSHTTTLTRLVTLGYYAPEYSRDGKTSAKCDIYSLGVTIMEIVTGSRQMTSMNSVLRKWRHRWNKSGKYKPVWHQQVTKCLELALRCLHKEPTQRPFIWDIIQELQESDRINSCLDSDDMLGMDLDDMLGIEPLEIHFLSEFETQSRSIQLTNNTGHYIAFMISTSMSRLAYNTQRNKGVIPPRSNYGAIISFQKQEAHRFEHLIDQFAVLSIRVDEGVTASDISQDMFDEGEGKDIDKVKVEVIFDT